MAKDSDDSSGDDDEAAGLQAQVAQMMGPIQAKVKKAEKKIVKLEHVVEELRRVGEELLPKMQKELMQGGADVSARLERVQAEVATLASKTSLEIAKEEATTSEQRLRQALDEQRSKTIAQDMLIQSLEARIDSMERQERARELKVSSELSAATAQLNQLSAGRERHKGETEARLSEQSARASTHHDQLLARIAQVEEEHHQLGSTLASKADLEALAGTVNRRAGESESGLSVANAQWKGTNEQLEKLRETLNSYATLAALETLDAKAESIASEMRSTIADSGAKGDAARSAWEDKLLTRQHGLEAQAQEARRDWHRLSAQLETLSTFTSERALRTEHDELAEAVKKLTAEAASKEELGAVEEVAKAAATGISFAVLESEVKALASSVKADAAAYEERFGRTASASEVTALDERVNTLAAEAERKMGEKEARFALDNKLEKSVGDATALEVDAMQARITQLNERTNESVVAVGKTSSAQERTTSKVEEVRSSVEELRTQHEVYLGELQRKGTEVHDLIKAVRALTADAEMRAALDEREIEFLWAAPGHIYGQHGWRPNNGSKSERTPYPVGNFKMAVRHGTEGNARDVLAQRRKWLNSITIGRREVGSGGGTCTRATSFSPRCSPRCSRLAALTLLLSPRCSRLAALLSSGSTRTMPRSMKEAHLSSPLASLLSSPRLSSSPLLSSPPCCSLRRTRWNPTPPMPAAPPPPRPCGCQTSTSSTSDEKRVMAAAAAPEPRRALTRRSPRVAGCLRQRTLC